MLKSFRTKLEKQKNNKENMHFELMIYAAYQLFVSMNFRYTEK